MHTAKECDLDTYQLWHWRNNREHVFSQQPYYSCTSMPSNIWRIGSDQFTCSFYIVPLAVHNYLWLNFRCSSILFRIVQRRNESDSMYCDMHYRGMDRKWMTGIQKKNENKSEKSSKCHTLMVDSIYRSHYLHDYGIRHKSNWLHNAYTESTSTKGGNLISQIEMLKRKLNFFDGSRWSENFPSPVSNQLGNWWTKWSRSKTNTHRIKPITTTMETTTTAE